MDFKITTIATQESLSRNFAFRDEYILLMVREIRVCQNEDSLLHHDIPQIQQL